ncbi:MAG: hypothetical protein ACYST5_07125, partial [Planctomycetota bacterium]
MNVNKVLIKDYENKPNWTPGENEPNSKPNKANLKNRSQKSEDRVRPFGLGSAGRRPADREA